MPTDYNGKWSVTEHGVMTAEMMDAMGIPADRRPNFPITKLDVEIKQDGDNFSIKSETAERSNEYSFVVGSTFETMLVAFLPKMSVAASWEGDNLLFTADNGFKMLREIKDGQMITTITKGDVKFQVFFKKV